MYLRCSKLVLGWRESRHPAKSPDGGGHIPRELLEAREWPGFTPTQSPAQVTH